MSGIAVHEKAYDHGTRANYVKGCRCGLCIQANRDYNNDVCRRAGEAAAQRPTVNAGPSPQEWTAPDGTVRTRIYKRACAGVNGEPCPHNSHLRKDSKGSVCNRCRLKLPEVWNGLVGAAPVRKHLRQLSRQGMGRDSVAAACDVAVTVIAAVVTGHQKRLRNQTARRILAVKYQALGDATLVPAGPTWVRINRLLKEGFTKKEIARRLGHKAPALQLRRDTVIARTAMQIERLYNIVMMGDEDEQSSEPPTEPCIGIDEHTPCPLRKNALVRRGIARCPDCMLAFKQQMRREELDRLRRIKSVTAPAPLEEVVSV